jgi:hypothetical protein
MSAIIDGSSDTFIADSTAGVVANRRVKLVTGRKLALAGAAEVEIGVTVLSVKKSDTQDLFKVQLRNAPGSSLVDAEDAFSLGAVVKRADLGKVAAGGAGADYGIADGDGAADGPVPVFPL